MLCLSEAAAIAPPGSKKEPKASPWTMIEARSARVMPGGVAVLKRAQPCLASLAFDAFDLGCCGLIRTTPLAGCGTKEFAPNVKQTTSP